MTTADRDAGERQSRGSLASQPALLTSGRRRQRATHLIPVGARALFQFLWPLERIFRPLLASLSPWHAAFFLLARPDACAPTRTLRALYSKLNTKLEAAWSNFYTP